MIQPNSLPTAPRNVFLATSRDQRTAQVDTLLELLDFVFRVANYGFTLAEAFAALTAAFSDSGEPHIAIKSSHLTLTPFSIFVFPLHQINPVIVA